ncbi:MAG: CotH kinase family protein [Verrucomicrobia bacterium]|nr:CotH kinase family protein [Verrucomicrobiota bacterium]
MSPPNLASLRVEGRKYVRANVRAQGEVFHDVGLHLKGATGSFRPTDDKPSLTLDFDRFVSGQNFGGLTKIHLNNSVEDASYLKEQIGSELFRGAQIPVPRAAHARVELNGRPLGFYVLKEGFTESFIARHFKRADGNLYDPEGGHDVDQRLKRILGRDSEDDQTALKRLAAAAVEPDLRRRWEHLRAALDMDRFLTFMAVEVMIGHWDGYGLGRNNFRIYHDAAADKIVFLPSGMDQIFSKADLPWKPKLRGLVARAVMETSEGRQQYAARFKELFETLFSDERLTNRVNQFLAELRPFLRTDELGTIRREAAELCAQIHAREISLRNQMSEPEPAFPDFKHGLAPLNGWNKVDEPAGGGMQEATTPERKAALHIVAGPKTSASWRTSIRLNPGRYRFRGEAKANGVSPLPFGENHGARLRVAGRANQSSELTGTRDWQKLEVDFEVSATNTEIVLMCELRASAGEAWFDQESLVIVRLP